MHPELEGLLKAWEAYEAREEGADAEVLFHEYEERLAEVVANRKLNSELLHRAIKRAFHRWQWADEPKFPKKLRSNDLD